MEQLTAEQSFAAMVVFLRAYWERGHSEEVADLLSGLQLLGTHRTADPAYWDDWMQAVRKVTEAAKNPDAWSQFEKHCLGGSLIKV